MEAAGDVRRRHHDGVGRGVRRDVAGERTRPLPTVVQLRLDLGGGIGLPQHHATTISSDGTAARPRRSRATAGFFRACRTAWLRSEEHTSALQSLMRNSYAVFRMKKKKHI